jgi:hypothetical protein
MFLTNIIETEVKTTEKMHVYVYFRVNWRIFHGSLNITTHTMYV